VMLFRRVGGSKSNLGLYFRHDDEIFTYLNTSCIVWKDFDPRAQAEIPDAYAHTSSNGAGINETLFSRTHYRTLRIFGVCLHTVIVLPGQIKICNNLIPRNSKFI
jgi:hypothetical protein